MMSDPGDISLSLQLNTPVSNGAGGETDSWASVQASLRGRLRNRIPVPFQYSETGPGTQKRTTNVVIFYRIETTLPAMPLVLSRYAFLTPAGARWKVLDRDDYEETVQFSVELVQ